MVQKLARLSLNQSDAKLKPITNWLPAFSRALYSLVGFTLSSHWLFRVLSFRLIGRCDFFGLGFKTLNRKALYTSTRRVLVALLRGTDLELRRLRRFLAYEVEQVDGYGRFHNVSGLYCDLTPAELEEGNNEAICVAAPHWL